MNKIKGKINSIQTLGALDGPGVRFTVFLQGCNLRCGCCHNPDTWDISGGDEFTAEEIADKAQRYKEYFGEKGGITLSGGEPLLQADFATEIFKECKKLGINTCLDTSGSVLNDSVLELLEFTDRVLLDIKYTADEYYKKYVGCSIEKPLSFLELLNQKKIPVTLRQVIIPTLNDDEENIVRLAKIINSYNCIDKAELLGFKKICQTKYDSMKIEFPFAKFPTPSREKLDFLEQKLESLISK